MNSSQPQKLIKELEELREQLRRQKNEISILNGQVVSLTESVEDLRQDKRDLRGHVEDLKNGLVRERDEVKRERAEKEEALRKVISLEKQLESSTRPLPGPSQKGPPSVEKSRIKSSPDAEHATEHGRILSKFGGPKLEIQSRSPSLEIVDNVNESQPKAQSSMPLLGKSTVKDNLGGGMSSSHLDYPTFEPVPKDEPPLSPTLVPSSIALGKRKAIEGQVPSLKKPRKTTPPPIASGNMHLVSEPAIEPTTVQRKSSPAEIVVPQEIPVKADPSPQRSRLVIKFKEEEAFTLPPGVVDVYLKHAPYLEIKPKPSDLHVRREFLRLAYGGSDQHFLQYIDQSQNPSGTGRRRLVFPMPTLNPFMPMQPGESGLLFASRHEVLENPPWGVFRRHLNGKDAVWLYLGEYESRLVGKISAQQFSSQRESVQQSWAKLLISQKTLDCYTSMRARIALRKAASYPTDDKALDEALVKTEMANVKTGQGLQVDEDDVIAAFCRGDEGIDIIRMECVAYDHTFATDIEAKYPNFMDMKKQRKVEMDRTKKLAGVKKPTRKDRRPASPSASSSSVPPTLASRLRRSRYTRRVESTPPIIPESVKISSIAPQTTSSSSSSVPSGSTRPQRLMRSTWDSERGQRVSAAATSITRSSRKSGTSAQESNSTARGLDNEDGYLSYVSDESSWEDESPMTD